MKRTHTYEKNKLLNAGNFTARIQYKLDFNYIFGVCVCVCVFIFKF